MTLKPISGLWVGGPLTYLEKLCLRSFLTAGHEFHLYTYGPVSGVPDGVEIKDAKAILRLESDPADYTYNQIEVLADRFKYQLLLQAATIWADLDMYCLKPWDFPSGLICAWQKSERVVGAAVLGSDKASTLISELNRFAQQEAPTPPWMNEHDIQDIRERRESGQKVDAADLKRGSLGVHALSYFVKKLSLTQEVMARNSFYPVEFSDRGLLTQPEDTLTDLLGEEVYGVHLWGRRLRRSISSGEMRIPPATSFLGKQLENHQISVDEATSDNATDAGLIKQNTDVSALDIIELKRSMAELEKKAARKFPKLAPPEQIPKADPEILVISSMKNEGPFILEWIAYHLSIGVTKFLIYTNDCSDGTDQILVRLQTLGIVVHLPNPYKKDKGQKPQRGALNDAVLQPCYAQADWTVCIDVDEFINIHTGDGTIPELIEASGYPNVISMTWRFFGNQNVPKYMDEFITEQFTRCAPEYLPKPRLGWGFKTLISKGAPYQKLGVHRPLQIEPNSVEKVRWTNGSGRVMPEMLLTGNGWRSTKRSIGYDLVTLNHYVLRSAESFLVKRERGRINHVDQDQGLEYWRARNYVTDFDDRIISRLPKAKETWRQLMEDSELAALHDAATAWHANRIADLLQQSDYQTLFNAIASDNSD